MIVIEDFLLKAINNLKNSHQSLQNLFVSDHSKMMLQEKFKRKEQNKKEKNYESKKSRKGFFSLKKLLKKEVFLSQNSESYLYFII